MFPRFCLQPRETGKSRPRVFYSLRGNWDFLRADKPHNSNVSKILPLTTFRTIDLGGKKISGPLFSRLCEEMRVFFEVFSAPEYVQELRGQQSCEAFRAGLGLTLLLVRRHLRSLRARLRRLSRLQTGARLSGEPSGCAGCGQCAACTGSAGSARLGYASRL